MSVSSSARFGLPTTATGPQYVAYIFRAAWGVGEGPLPLERLWGGVRGGKSPSLFEDTVSHPKPDNGISQLGLPISPTGLRFPYHLRSERPKPTVVTPQPRRKQKL